MTRWLLWVYSTQKPNFPEYHLFILPVHFDAGSINDWENVYFPTIVYLQTHAVYI